MQTTQNQQESKTVPHKNQRHGHSRRRQRSATYLAWSAMWRRCIYPSQRNYPLYGGRGITVCNRWASFENFLADMGEKPDGMTLDRIDSDGNYEPGNCRWATMLEQNRNRCCSTILEYQGRRMSLTEWADELGIKPKTLRARIDDHCWSVEKALSTPVRRNKRAHMAESHIKQYANNARAK